MYGISDGLLHRLQSVQNAAVRLVTGVYQHDRGTPLDYCGNCAGFRSIVKLFSTSRVWFISLWLEWQNRT